MQDAGHFHAATQIGHLGFERQRRAALRHRFYIAANTERAAGTLEQNRADLVIFRRAPRRVDKAARHLRIERVAPIGTIHGDREQSGIELLQDDVVVHEVWLSLLLKDAHSNFRCPRRQDAALRFAVTS